MRRLSRTNTLRLGIILLATGIIALAHALLSTGPHLGTQPTFILGMVLIVLGVPFQVKPLPDDVDRHLDEVVAAQRRLAAGEA